MHFLSTFLLKEQVMILCQTRTANKYKTCMIVQTSWANFPAKLRGNTYKQLVFLMLLLLYRPTVIIFWKKLAKLLSILVKNVCEISANPITFQQNVPRKFPLNQLFLLIVFLLHLPWKFLLISCEICHFFYQFVSESTVNLTFFCDLSEALTIILNTLKTCIKVAVKMTLNIIQEGYNPL